MGETRARGARAGTAVEHGPTPVADASPGLLPGLGLCAAAVALAMLATRVVPGVSPLLFAILLGVALAAAVPLPAATAPGLAFAARRLLRAGVVLLGLQLALSDIVGLGAGVVAVVVAVVVAGITVTLAAGRLLGIGFTQRLLIACGFSICGAAAVAAVDGVVDADEEDVATAIGLVVVFGTLMIPAVPLASGLLGLSPQVSGVWAGGSIHEVAQVVAAGGVIGGPALAVAVVVKLARVMMLAPVLAAVGWHQRRTAPAPDGGTRPPLVPLFVVGFVAAAMLRTSGVLPDGVLQVAGLAQSALLAAAMFALGCGVRIASVRRIGPRPFLLAACSTVVVAGVALGGAVLVA